MRRFRNKLVVSVQDNPLWQVHEVIASNPGGLRLNTAKTVAWVREMLPDMCIVACNKVCVGERVWITPDFESVHVLADAGADYIAFDARGKKQCKPVKEMIETIHERGCGAVADIATKDQGIVAARAGAEIVATTLATNGVMGVCFTLSRDGIKVMAEGGVHSPEMAKELIDGGADLICVGAAITKPKEITKWFVRALT
jgi:N-acylglucosamine-6-phosphate 2-epimerase